MRRIFIILVFLLILLSCKKSNINELNMNRHAEIWNGCYLYEEKPVEAVNKQYYQAMEWLLEINSDTCNLFIRGFQTGDDFKCDYEVIDHGINIVFIEDVSQFKKSIFKKGDVLFQLKYNSKNELCTYWYKEGPLLSGGKFENGKINFIKKDCVESKKLINIQ